MTEPGPGAHWQIDHGRIPADLKTALEQQEHSEPSDITVFKNALRHYWTVASAASGPGANEAALLARLELDDARELARSQGVNVDQIEADFKAIDLGLDQ